MSEGIDHHEVSEQNLEQAAGGENEYGSREFVFRCLKCDAIKIIRSVPFPVPVPTCCGADMNIERIYES